MRKKTNRFPAALGAALFGLGAAAALWGMTAALDSLERGSAEEGRLRLEEALRQAAVTCYAVEGAYPASLADLTERSGIRIDTERYIVHYVAIAENLVPDITVLNNGG